MAPPTLQGRVSTWPGRPDLSDTEHFWTAPIAERGGAFAALREREPLSYFAEPQYAYLLQGPGYWALTRLDDVVEASRNPAVFTSGSGSTSVADMLPEVREFYGSMISMDDPRHTRLRGMVSRGFTPKRLAHVTDEVARTAARIVDDVIDAGECDAVSAISARVLLKIVCDMMGAPESQYDFVLRTSNVILGVNDPEYVPDAGNILVALLKAGNDLADLMRDLGALSVPVPGPAVAERHERVTRG